LVGCLGARVVRRRFAFPQRTRVLTSGIGLWMVVYSIFCLGNVSRWPNLWTLLPTIGTCLILISPESEGQRSLVAQVLSLPILRFVGLISYSLYLWHWPLLVFMREYRSPNEMSLWDRWIIIGISIAIAAASWRFVEQPFRYRCRFFEIGLKRFLAGAAAGWALLMGITVWARNSNGFEALFAGRLSPEARRVILPPREVESDEQYDATGSLDSGGVRLNGSNSAPRCVAIGDSHGTALGPVIESLSRDYHFSSVMLTQGGTPGFFAGTNTFVSLFRVSNAEKQRRDGVIKHDIEKWKPDLLIIAGRWPWQMTYCWGPGRSISTAALEQACRESTAWLADRCGKVIILTDAPVLPLPEAPDNGPQMWKLFRQNFNTFPKLFETPADCDLRKSSAALLRRAADPRVTIIETSAVFQCSDNSIRYYGNNGTFYRDNNHLNRLGAMELALMLNPLFAGLSVHSQPVALELGQTHR
jgi:hypothetical protein